MEYETTHPWLAFSINLNAVGPRLWIALGEAQAKCEQIAGTPLRPDVAKELHTVYLVKGIRATTAIEGNTLSEREVRDRIEGRLTLPRSREYLGQEVENILTAANDILARVENEGPRPLDTQTLRDFNRRVLHGLDLDDDVRPGVTRQRSVGVARYRGAPHQDCDHLMGRLCDWLNGPEFKADAGMETVYGILKSVIAHLYFVWIHPFEDGNGRTARLIEVEFLLEAGVPSAAAHLLSNHYNLTRTEYYRRLDLASRTGGNIIPFIEYAVQGFVDQLQEHSQAIRFQQWRTTWENYVHDVIGEPRTPAQRRQLKLVMAISHTSDPVKRGELRHLTPELAEEYASRTSKTMSRDLNALLKLDLISREEDGRYRASMDKIFAFLPRTRKGDDNRPKISIVEDESGQLTLLL